MRKFKFVFALMFILILSSSAYAGVLDNFQSPAEQSNWQRTTSSQEVVDYVKYVAENSDGRIRYEEMGYSTYGKPIPLAIVGVPSAPKSPSEVGNRIVIHIQCNIHSGEVEGKEASLILLREIAQGKHDDLLKDAVLLYNSNFNPDGNDTLGNWRANSQPTPALVGTRTNAQGFNLNRDFVRLASPEARAHVRLWRKWNPAIVLDEHATDGVRHRHPLNYNSGLNPNVDPDFKTFNRLLLESIFGVGIGPKSDPSNNFFKKYMSELATKEPGLFSDGRPGLTESVRVVPYMEGYGGVGLVSTDTGGNERRPGHFTAGGSDSVRTTTAMPTIKNRLTLLLECHSHNNFRYRVHVQYAATISAIEHLSKQKDDILNYLKSKDEAASNRTTPDGVKIYPTYNSSPVSDDYDLGFGKGLITIEGFAYAANASGDRISTTIDPTEDRTWENLECRTKFLPTSEVPMGALYILDPAAKSSVEVLLMHGVKVYRLIEDVKLPASSTLKFYNPANARGNWTVSFASSSYEGAAVVNLSSIVADWNPVSADGHVVTAGHYVISTAQPFGKFAAFLLEPRASDGLCYWGFWNEQLFSSENNASGSFDIVKTSSYSLIPASALEQLILPEDEEQAPSLNKDDIPAIFTGGVLPAGAKIIQENMSDGSIRYYYVPQNNDFVNEGVILDGEKLAAGWEIAGVDPFVGTNWKLSIVDNKVVVTCSGPVDNAAATITLLHYNDYPSNTVDVHKLWVNFSGDYEKKLGNGGGGCEIGYAAFGLIALALFIIKRKK